MRNEHCQFFFQSYTGVRGDGKGEDSMVIGGITPFHGQQQAVYIYAFCSACKGDLPNNSALMHQDLQREAQGRLFWLQAIVCADGRGYHVIENPGDEPGNGRGWVVLLPMIINHDNRNVIMNHFCVSRVNFSSNRIIQLLEELSSGKCDRLQTVNIFEAPYAGSSIRQIMLTDYLAVAQSIHGWYINAYNDYLAWITDEERAELRVMSGMIDQIITIPGKNYSKYLRPDGSRVNGIPGFSQWKTEYRQTEEIKERDCRKFCRILAEYWLLKDGFKATLEDYSETEYLQEVCEQELEKCISGIDKYEEGRIYLINILNNFDSNWIGRYVFNTDRKEIDATWPLLQLFTSIELSGAARDRLVDLLLETIRRRTGNSDVSFTLERIPDNIASPSRLKVTITDRRSGIVRNTVIDAIDLTEALPENRRIPPQVEIVILLIEIYLRVTKEGGVSTVEDRLGLAKVTINISNAVLNIAVKNRNLPLLRFGGGGALVASSIISTIISVFNMRDAIISGDRGATVGHGVGIAAGALSTIQFICTILSIGTGPLGWVVFGVSLTGIAIVRLTPNSDLEKWLGNCIWGKDASSARSQTYWDDEKDALNLPMFTRVGFMQLQIICLQYLIYGFKAETVDVSRNSGTNEYTITVKPHTRVEKHAKIYLIVFVESVIRTTILYGRMLDSSNYSVRNEGEICIKIRNTERHPFIANPPIPVHIPNLTNYIADARNPLSPVYLRALVIMDVYGDGSIIMPYVNNLTEYISKIKEGHFGSVPTVRNDYYIKLERVGDIWSIR